MHIDQNPYFEHGSVVFLRFGQLLIRVFPAPTVKSQSHQQNSLLSSEDFVFCLTDTVDDKIFASAFFVTAFLIANSIKQLWAFLRHIADE